ncbi:MAG: hypothetical protein RLO52_13210 [Sandaracinaceae bacterium]
MALEPVCAGPQHRFAGVENVLVCVYWGAPPAEALHDRVPWVEKAIARYGAIGVLVVVPPEASGHLPDRAFREESRAQADRFRDAIRFSASVIEGDDVQHALIRTFLRGLAVVAARGMEVRFFRSVHDGAAWASERAAALGGPSPRSLVQAVEALRAQGPGR